MTNPGLAPRKKKGLPITTVRYGSTAIPIYAGKVKGITRYTVAFYLNERRARRTFGSLEKAKKEARLVAQQIQIGSQQANDLRPHERETYLASIKLLKDCDIPLVTAIEEYVQCREILGTVPLMSAVQEFKRGSIASGSSSMPWRNIASMSIVGVLKIISLSACNIASPGDTENARSGSASALCGYFLLKDQK